MQLPRHDIRPRRQLSIAEAQHRFPEVVEAAERGESLTLTCDGRPFLTLVPTPVRNVGIDWEALAQWREAQGRDNLTVDIDPRADTVAYSRRVLGLPE